MSKYVLYFVLILIWFGLMECVNYFITKIIDSFKKKKEVVVSDEETEELL